MAISVFTPSAKDALNARRDGLSVCAFVPYPLGSAPSQRFRLEQWTPVLAEAGIRVDLKPFAHPGLMRVLHSPHRVARKALSLALAFARRAFASVSVDGYDAVIVHRAAALVGPAVLERLVARRRPVIFDFDDAIFLTHTTAANRPYGWLKFAGKTGTICRMSAHVVVGNAYLAAYARRYNSNVTIVPSSVDIDDYRPVDRARGDRVVIGWMGSSTSQTHLEQFAPLLREIASRRPVEIRVVSDRRPELDGVNVDWRRWSAESEVSELRGFDIGIMPMPDDAWAEGKCAMKALLYMSVGVPVVCSAVGVNRQLIRHGANGFLATSTDDWVGALLALIDRPDVRASIGHAGRGTVESEYSRRTCGERFAAVIRQTVGSRGRRDDGHA